MRKVSSKILTMLLVISLSLLTNFTLATEWTLYKNNPQHTGVATDALEPPLELFWKFETEGPVVSSPVVYGGTIYFGSSAYYVYAIDSLTGELKWKFRTNGRIDASPAVWEDTVYVSSLDGNLYALDTTGKLKWKFEALGSIVSSPVVEYGLVFFGSTGGFVYAVNATTGEKEWAFKTGGKVEASPAVYGQLLLVGSYDGKVYALGAKSGILLWTFDAGEPITSGSVVADSGTVYVIAGAKYLYALDVTNGEVKWKKEIGRKDYVSAYDNLNKFEAISSSTKEASVLGGAIYSYYYYERWKLYLFSTKYSKVYSKHYLASFDTQNGQKKWQFEVGGPIHNAPTVSGSTVYFGCDDGYLYAIHADSGELKWKYLINSSIRSSPVIANGILYVGADDGYLYAFASDEVVGTYSELTSVRELVNDLREEGINLPEDVDDTLSIAEHYLKTGEIDRAKSEISKAKGIISKARYDHVKELLAKVNETYIFMESQGFDVTTVKTLIVQAQKELNAGNYDKALELTNKANDELQNIKSSEAERAQALLSEVELELESLENITNISALESSLADAREKIQNEEYPRAVAILEEIKQKITTIKEANNAILGAEAIIGQKKVEGLNTTEAENLLEKARELFNAGDYEGAKNLAEQAAIILVPENANQTANEVTSTELIPGTGINERILGMEREYLMLALTLIALLISIFVARRKKKKASIKFDRLTFSIVEGNIIDFPAEAIVNSVDKHLSYKGSVSRHVAKAAVGDVHKYREITRDAAKKQIGRDWIRHGEVIVTPPFRLKQNGVRYIINTFGPDCKARWNKELEETLKLAILAALRKADELGVERVAFPPIKAGASACPFKHVVRTFLESVEEFSKEAKNVKEVFLVLLKEKDYYDTALEVLREWKHEKRKKKTLRKHELPEKKVTPQNKEFPPELLDKYEPLEFLGEGGFAKVFKAKRRKDGEIVALKVPHIDDKTSSLFLKEIAAWYHLNHPNIVRLYKADILPIPYLEMEYVEGINLDGKPIRDLDKYPKPVDEKTALQLIRDIAEGLAHAHSKGIYHHDLKPLNVLLKSDLTPKITDWGLAKISARSSLSTHSGYSPLYAAPEQLDESLYGTPDHRTDIYQLGVVFYELLTGKLPYEGYSPGAVVGKILAENIKPLPPSRINPQLAKYDGIFEKLLAKRKEDRYQSVEEFLAVMESLKELDREIEGLKRTKETLKRSRSGKEIQRLKREAVEKTARIAILSAKLNDKAGLLNALEDLKLYTKENLDDLLNAIAQVEELLKEGIPVSTELIERLTVLLHRIQRENEVS